MCAKQNKYYEKKSQHVQNLITYKDTKKLETTRDKNYKLRIIFKNVSFQFSVFSFFSYLCKADIMQNGKI